MIRAVISASGAPVVALRLLVRDWDADPPKPGDRLPPETFPDDWPAIADDPRPRYAWHVVKSEYGGVTNGLPGYHVAAVLLDLEAAT